MNDHNLLRNYPLIQTAVGIDKNLASAPTISRFKRSLYRKTLFKINEIFVEIFIKSYKKSPKEIILDFDWTDDKVHGNQIGAMFHGDYNHKCFLWKSFTCCLSKHCLAILKLLVKKIRTHWPNVNIIFRGDGAFCRHKIFNWCERNDVKYITVMPANSRLVNCSKLYINQSENLFIKSEKTKNFW